MRRIGLKILGLAFLHILSFVRNKSTLVARNMEFLGKVMQWNLRYMHVVLDLKSGCSLLFLFYV